VRLRLVAPVLLVLAVTAGGFVAARMLADRAARQSAEHRADIAATEVRNSIQQATSLVESLRRFLLGDVGDSVTNARFVDIGARSLSPVGLPAAAWVEKVPEPATRKFALRATLVTGASPMTHPGIDLIGEAVLAAGVADPRTLFRVTATPLAHLRDGRTGLFLVQSAPRLSDGVLEPGFVVLFVPVSWLLTGATAVTGETIGGLQLRIDDTSSGDLGNAVAVGRAFSAGGRRFDVLVPEKQARGGAALFPWLVLGGGLVLAVLAAMLAAISERRARAQREADRIFSLSPDVITVAGFDGSWKRVNPAFEALFGYTEREARGRPYLEFVHPDDRENSAQEAGRLRGGDTTQVFANRMLCKDGSYRWMEWIATPVPAERVLYGVARDVTERRRTASEQAALRRLATLVAEGGEPQDLFAVVAEEVARVVDVSAVSVVRYELDGTATECANFNRGEKLFPTGVRWSIEGTNILRLVRDSAAAARIDDYAGLDGEMAAVVRDSGIRSTVGVPIVVAGRLWGTMVGSTTEPDPLPEDTAARLADFTELLATAIQNAESREALESLADEQATLRRLATLVAQGVPPAEIFSAVSDDIGRLFGSDAGAVVRFDHDAPAIVLAGVSKSIEAVLPVGTRWSLDDNMASAEVYRTGRSARVDATDWSSLSGAVAAAGRRLGVASTVASPVVVEGRPWGAVSASSTDQPLPPDAEERLERFTELVATAIANAESRAALGVLADEQTALRRVAMLVARGAPPAELFAAVTEEAGQLLPVTSAAMGRYDPDGLFTTVAAWTTTVAVFPAGIRSIPGGKNILTLVLETGRPARMDTFADASGPVGVVAREAGYRSAVGTPIMVEGRLWGVMTAASSADEPLPVDTEARLASFTELVATAIANAESRAALRTLADEQAALRRVAVLVAQQPSPDEVFTAVTEAVGHLLGVDLAAMHVFPGDGTATVIAGWSDTGPMLPIGTRLSLDGDSVVARIFDTSAPARMNTYVEVGGETANVARGLDLRSTVGAPILVDGKLWGALMAATRGDEPLPEDAETRIAEFTELVATAIANAESRSELAASRARIVAASDEARRRIERDLHDGAQQRLVSLSLALRAAEASVPPDTADLRSELSSIAVGLADAVGDLQELSRGIHPAILSEGGLGPALRTLARRSTIPVQLDVATDTRLPEPIEVAAYFVVSEALANVTKHAQASCIEVSLASRSGSVVLSIRDDGVGGADPRRGSGLVGLTDRVEALGGTIDLGNAPGGGTSLVVTFPLVPGPTQG
jgi:PAS domain S-box-containing protein